MGKGDKDMKKFLLLLCAVMATVLSGAEVFRAQGRGDWDGRPEVDAEGVFTATFPRRLISMKSFKVDPAKTYTISGEFRVQDCDKLQPFFFGFVPKTADGQRISAVNLRQFGKSSLGKVVADVPAGAKEVVLLDAQNWPSNPKGLFLAVNAKADKSDLPNMDVVPVRSIKNENGKTVVTLQTPLKKALAKDSFIRLHSGGASFIYTGKNGGYLSEEWQKFSGTIGAKGQWKWYPGTDNASVVIVGGGNNGIIQLRNITVTEE